MRQKPTVLAREIVASSRLFRVEEVQLRFSNGVERTYERLVGRGNGYGAVMIVAMIDAEHAILVEEYCGGTDEYEIVQLIEEGSLTKPVIAYIAGIIGERFDFYSVILENIIIKFSILQSFFNVIIFQNRLKFIKNIIQF